MTEATLQPSARRLRTHGRLSSMLVGGTLVAAVVLALQAISSTMAQPAHAGDTAMLPLVRFLLATAMWSGGIIALAFLAPRPGLVTGLFGITLVVGGIGAFVAYDLLDAAAHAFPPSLASGYQSAIGVFGAIGGSLLFASGMIALVVHLRQRG